MRLRVVFLVCFAAASLPAVGWSAWTAARAWTAWTDAEAAVRAAGAMGHALHLVEALSVERGALQERALSERPGAEDLGRIAVKNDALLDRAQRSMRAAGLPDEAVVRAREMLASSRARVAAEVVRPLAERDPGLVPAILGQLYARLDAVEAAVAQAEAKAAQASATVGALVAVGSLSVEMRAAAGRRSSHLSGWMGGRPLSPRQVEEAMYLTGQLQHAWDRLRRQVLLVQVVQDRTRMAGPGVKPVAPEPRGDRRRVAARQEHEGQVVAAQGIGQGKGSLVPDGHVQDRGLDHAHAADRILRIGKGTDHHIARRGDFAFQPGGGQTIVLDKKDKQGIPWH